MDSIEFWSVCASNGLPLSQEQMASFERYANDLLYWNEKVNLISRRDTEQIWLRHLLHSLTPILMKFIPDVKSKILDIGSGGGLPGIPLKIAYPKIEMILLDSIAKKVQTSSMLASHITKFGLKSIRNRAEEMPNDPNSKIKFDFVVSRAVAPLVDLMKWSKPILKPDSPIVTLKGGDLTNEILQAQTKFPLAKIEVFDIEIEGTDWFLTEEKKIVKVNF